MAADQHDLEERRRIGRQMQAALPPGSGRGGTSGRFDGLEVVDFALEGDCIANGHGMIVGAALGAWLWIKDKTRRSR